jgi:hypothetical protein
MRDLTHTELERRAGDMLRESLRRANLSTAPISAP